MTDEEKAAEFDNSEQDENQYDESYVNTRIRRNKQERGVRRSNMWMRRFKVFLRILAILFLSFVVIN